MVDLPYIIQHRRGTTSEWQEANPVLHKAERGVEFTVDGSIREKVGDGVTAWADLAYVGGGGGSGGSYDDTQVRALIATNTANIKTIDAEKANKSEVLSMFVGDAVTLSYGDIDNTSVLLGRTPSILIIGNSFSYDAHEFLHSALEAAGVTEYTIARAVIDGSALELHHSYIGSSSRVYSVVKDKNGTRTTATMSQSEVLQNEPWDIVTFQQVSGDSGIYDTISPYLQGLIDEVKKQSPTAKVGYNQAWPYAKNSTHSKFPLYDSNQLTMYRAQNETLQKILSNYSDVFGFVANHTMFQSARTFPDLISLGNELTRDGYHAEYHAGRFLASLGIYVSLIRRFYGLDYNDIVYASLPSELRTVFNNSQFENMLKVADATYIQPFALIGEDNSVDVQKSLVSGETIKTINNQSLLGSGNISISGGSGSEPSVVEDLASKNISMSIAGNTVYLYGELSSLEITEQDGSYVQSLIFFKSGDTPTVITYPENAGHIPSLINVEGNTNYIIKVVGGYFELIKRTPPEVTPVDPYTVYTDYTPIQGYCTDWAGGEIDVTTTIDGGSDLTYTNDLSTPSVVKTTAVAFVYTYTTSKRPLSLPSGTIVEVSSGVSYRICKGATVATGSRGNQLAGPATITLTEDSIFIINTKTAFTVSETVESLRADLDTRMTIKVPTEKLSQVNNNEA